MTDDAGIFETLLTKKDSISFHTPAHNNGLLEDIIYTDTTELPYTDNLLNPVGLLKRAEEKIAAAYRADFARMFTNGATGAVFCAIKAAQSYGDFLIYGEHTHVSVFNAIRLFNAKAYVCFTLPDKIPNGVKSLIITSPNSFGETLPLSRIRSYCDEKNLILIIDGSHGAHFAFSTLLPVSASEYGDLAVLSLHKTMPVITGGAVLCGRKAFAEDTLTARKLTHTTSPNYMVLSTIDKAVSLFSKFGEFYYSEIKKALISFKSALPSDVTLLANDDFSRAVLECEFDADAALTALTSLGIDSEFSFGNKLVFIVTPYNYTKLDILAKKLFEIPRIPYMPYVYREKPFGIIELNYGNGYRLVDVKDIVGERAYLEVGLYPPGTPFIYGGQIFTEKDRDMIEKNINRCFGLVNNRVTVVL